MRGFFHIMKLYIQEQFAQTPNSLIKNSEISLRAKWLYSLMQSKPNGWEFSADRIANETKEWVWVIKSALRELESFWYLIRKKYKDEKGHWAWEHLLVAIPQIEVPEDENPSVEIRPTVNRPIQNRPTNKERDNKKDINKKKDIYIQEFLEKYPRQRLVSKTKVAEKLRRETEENLSLIVLALSEFLKYWEQEKTEIQYIPMATTWLNQKRWEIPPEIKQKQPNSSDIYTNPIN